MKDYINWAILAPGKAANSMAKAMTEIAKTDSRIHLYAIGSRSKIRAENCAKQWGFLKFYGSYEKLANDPRVDAVYVSNPHALHYDTVMKLLAKGKHVLCEKPAGCNLDELVSMMELANTNGLFFMEGMWTAFNPLLHKIRDLINDGVIGKVLNIDSSFCIRKNFDKESRYWNPDLAGGALLDLGIYNLYFSMFMNNFTGIEYFTSNVRLKNNVDAWNSVSITFSNKTTATFRSSLDMSLDSPTQDGIIYGTRGFIKIKDFYKAQEGEIYIYDLENENKIASKEIIKEPFKINGFEYELLDATNQILEGFIESEYYTNIQSIYLTSIMNDIRQQWDFKYPFEK